MPQCRENWRRRRKRARRNAERRDGFMDREVRRGFRAAMLLGYASMVRAVSITIRGAIQGDCDTSPIEDDSPIQYSPRRQRTEAELDAMVEFVRRNP